MRLRRGSEKHMDPETAEMLDRFGMTPEQEVEYVYNKYKDMPSTELVVELEALQRRYGRVASIYRAVIDDILKRRSSAAADKPVPEDKQPGTLGFA